MANANGLNVPPPPKKKQTVKAVTANDQPKKKVRKSKPVNTSPSKFDKVAEGGKVQFNKRINRATADGFDMLAITSRRKVPELLDEALGLLKEKYGQI